MLVRFLAVLSLTALSIAAPARATEAPYPSKPIRIIVPWAAGGAADFLARQVGHGLTARLGVPVIVENRPGAATNIGTQAAASADADGYTLLMASSNNCVNVTLYPSLRFDFRKAFRPVSNVGVAPNVLVVNPTTGVRDLKSLISLAKQKPDGLTYASSGNGSASHLAAELFKERANVKITGVPYKGAAPAVTDLLGNQVSMMFTVLPPTLGHIRAGKLTAIAVAARTRLPMLPDVPTVSESGLPGFESSIWYGLVVPAGAPDTVVDKLQDAVGAVVREPAIIARFREQGIEPVGDGAASFAKTISEDIRSYASVIRAAHIKAE